MGGAVGNRGQKKPRRTQPAGHRGTEQNPDNQDVQPAGSKLPTVGRCGEAGRQTMPVTVRLVHIALPHPLPGGGRVAVTQTAHSIRPCRRRQQHINQGIQYRCKIGRKPAKLAFRAAAGVLALRQFPPRQTSSRRQGFLAGPTIPLIDSSRQSFHFADSHGRQRARQTGMPNFLTIRHLTFHNHSHEDS